MAQSAAESNRYIHDPVPKNVTKFPIHQTYLTADAERTGSGGYRFKAPEVWSSARSGKKSIGVRSIQPLPRSYIMSFKIWVKNESDPEEDYHEFEYSTVINSDSTVVELLGDIKDKFNAWLEEGEFTESAPPVALSITYVNNAVTFEISKTSGSANYSIYITAIDVGNKPSESFNIFFNQPKSTLLPEAHKLTFSNVWDHSSQIYFHASFIPFDHYQYLGELRDEWQTPIIYQDTDGSPLFNVWTTTDLKTPFPILHETFIIRLTFIISIADNYQ